MRFKKIVLFAFLSCFSFSLMADQIIFRPNPTQGKDMWHSSVYNNAPVNDNNLVIGGWGDYYRSLIMFDTVKLPTVATSAVMWMYSIDPGGTSTNVPMKVYMLSKFWSETGQNYSDTLYGSSIGTVPAPKIGEWYGLNITSIYNGWKSGTYPNHGFAFLTTENNNRFNKFRSSDYSNPKYRPYLVVTYDGLNLDFPLDCSTPNCSGSENITYSNNPYTANSITSVVDHSMTKSYGNEDGTVLAWNGETGKGTAASLGCYPKTNGQPFSLFGTYVGSPFDGCDKYYINYDSHPGYDYVADYNTPVKASATGKVVSFEGQRCIPKGISAGCVAWGTVGIDHGNGYITQYMHMSKVYVKAGDTVNRGQVIGLSGNTSPKILGEHLHFEVLKKVAGSTGTSLNDYKVVDPYGWISADVDPLESSTGIKNDCLWRKCKAY